MSSVHHLRVINGIAPPSPFVRALKGLVLTLACAAVAVPFLAVFATSLASREQLNAAGGFVLWPTDPTFDAYRAIFAGGVVSRALLVSIGVTVVGTLLSVVCVTLTAYALSRPDSYGHRPMLLTVLFTLLFSPGMIPMYLMVKQLGLLDSWWSLILPGLANAFNIIIVRAFFLELPDELLDSARIDGAGELQILLRIALPLSRAVVAVVALFTAVSYWNAFFNALLYLNDTQKWPIQLVLRTYVVDNTVIGSDLPGEVIPPQQSLQMAILVISLIPIVLVYPFLQRHFAKGILIGAVKG